MNSSDHDAEDPVLDTALSQLPRTLIPSAGYADRVLGELQERGLVRHAPSRAHRMLVAAGWFIAGVGTGAAALGMMSRDRTEARPIAVTSVANMTSTPAEPVEWY
jgi:hypothetical protein